VVELGYGVVSLGREVGQGALEIVAGHLGLVGGIGVAVAGLVVAGVLRPVGVVVHHVPSGLDGVLEVQVCHGESAAGEL